MFHIVYYDMSKEIGFSLLLLLLLFYSFCLNEMIVSAPLDLGKNWLSGWQYRKSLEVVGSTAGAVTDYQVRIKVHYDAGTDSGEDVYLGQQGVDVETGSWVVDGYTYHYRAKIIIMENAGQDLIDYQVKVVLDTKRLVDSGYATANGNEVRFTDSDGSTLLNFWRETDFNQATTIYWVKVPFIPASATKEIYMYFDSDLTSVSDAGDPLNVFDLYLNFSSLTMLSEGSGSQDVSGNGEVLDGGRTFHTWGNSWKVFTGFGSFNIVGDGSQRLDLKIKATDTGEITGVKFDTNTRQENAYGYKFAGSQSYWITPDQSYTNNGNWQDVYAILNDFSISATHIHLPIDDDADASGNVYYKDVRIRKYVNPEPSLVMKPNCRADFGDIRFTDSDGITELSYWMEQKVDGDYAVFWVKIPSIPQSPETKTIYIYYGKEDATTTSDGKATFDFFEGWETCDLAGWTVNANGDGAALVTCSSENPRSGSYSARVYTNDYSINAWTYAFLQKLNIFSHSDNYKANFLMFLNLQDCNEKGGYRIGFEFTDGTGNKKRINYVFDLTRYGSTEWETGLNSGDNRRIDLTPPTFGSYFKFERDVTQDFASKFGFNPYQNGYFFTGLIFENREDHTGTGNRLMFIDDLAIRKYISPAPSYGVWGSEEEAPTNQAPAPPTLDCPVVNAHFDPSASVTFSWIFNDPDAEDSQSAYQFQLDDNNDFSSPIIDTGKVTSTASSTTQTLPSTVGLYYWRVKTWDSQDAEGAWSEARSIIVDRIKIISGGVVDFTIDVDVGGKIWYYAVYEYDNSTFDDSCGVLYVDGFEMTWDGEKWIYAFPYSTEGNQMTFHITGALDNQYGLTTMNNQVGDIIINWAKLQVTITNFSSFR